MSRRVVQHYPGTRLAAQGPVQASTVTSTHHGRCSGALQQVVADEHRASYPSAMGGLVISQGPGGVSPAAGPDSGGACSNGSAVAMCRG